jgi:hypothetical protein
MVIVIICILLAAIIGGGIYLWVKRQRKALLQKAKKLAESSQILDPAKPSVLDSVVSPVSNPSTSSTGSDRPQINASSDDAPKAAGGVRFDDLITGGSDSDKSEAAGENASAEALNNSKYTASFRKVAPTIKDLAAKLLVAWDNSSAARNEVDRLWSDVRSARNSSSSWSKDCRNLSESAEIEPFVTGLNKDYATELARYKNWLAGVVKVVPAAQAAADAFEALRQALKPFEKHESGQLPPDLQVLCCSAHMVLETSKDSIERQIKEAQENQQKLEKEETEGTPEKPARVRKLFAGDENTFAEGTHQDDESDTREARRALIEATHAAIEERLRCHKALAAAQAIVNKMESHNGQSFTYPKKPVPEEITRFLGEVEQWSRDKLATERQVEPMLNAYNEAIKALKETIKDLKRERGRTTPVLTDAARTFDDGLILAVNKVVSDLETALANANSEHSKLLEQKPKLSASTSKVSAEEEATVNALRATARTIAFALAQRSVAATKLTQIQQDEPSVDTSPPRLDRSDPFSKYLDRYQVFFDRRAKQQEEYSKWAAARDLIQMAYEARRAKVVEVKEALAKQMAAVLKTSTTRAQTAEELLVVGGMSTKIVELIKS